MDMDLDDLLEDAPTRPTKSHTTAQRHTSAAVGRFAAGKKGADLDDLGDSFNFDDVIGSDPAPSKAPAKQTTFGAGGANYGGAG
mmetsp:Transcript_72/g.136  ORF Transcript_72/g.136 Transcript_72/m.136 type:complete len:84 (+) Transcript_72:1-252(+)